LNNRISIRSIVIASATAVTVTGTALGAAAWSGDAPAPTTAAMGHYNATPVVGEDSARELAGGIAGEKARQHAAVAAARKAAVDRAHVLATAKVAKAKRERAAVLARQKAVAAERARKQALEQARERAAARERAEARERKARAAQKRATRSTTRVVGSGSAQSIARAMVADRGWGTGQFSCLVTLWNHESGWRVTAENPSSGAYGIPQALPGSKMASAGSDWRTSAATQIRWGLTYISGRYGTPCSALAAWQAKGWY